MDGNTPFVQNRNEKLLVSEDYKVFILTGQQEDGTRAALRIKPFNKLETAEIDTLKSKAEPLSPAHHIDIVVKDNPSGYVTFTDNMTGKTAQEKISDLDESVQAKLVTAQDKQPDPFKELAQPAPVAPVPNKPISLKAKFMIAVAAIGGIYGINYGATMMQDATQKMHAPVVQTVEQAPLVLTGIKEQDLQYDTISQRAKDDLYRELNYYIGGADAAFVKAADKGDVTTVLAQIKANNDGLLKRVGPLAMVAAAQNGDLDMINILHRAGVDPNTGHKVRHYVIPVTWLPLVQAVDRGMPQTVGLLLSLKANPDATEEAGTQTPFMKAVYAHYDEATALSIMDKLVAAKADITVEMEPKGHDALSIAVGSRSLAKINYVLDHLPDPAKAVNKPYNLYSGFYDQTAKGTTLFMHSLEQEGYNIKGIPPVTKLLMDRGADITAKDDNGATAMHYTAWQDQMDVMKMLVKKGMDPRQKTNNGSTPLIIAQNSFPHPINALSYLGALGKAKVAQHVPTP